VAGGGWPSWIQFEPIGSIISSHFEIKAPLSWLLRRGGGRESRLQHSLEKRRTRRNGGNRSRQKGRANNEGESKNVEGKKRVAEAICGWRIALVIMVQCLAKRLRSQVTPNDLALVH
jgi:hypothetical protein